VSRYPEVSDRELDVDASRHADRPIDGSRQRTRVEFRARTYLLRSSEHEMMRHVGMFRIVDEHDLRKLLYGGNRSATLQDLRSLREQGLIRRHTMTGSRQGRRLAVVSLTAAGAALVREQSGPGQTIYDGFVKPREVPHDSALYRMYHAEVGRVHRNGGRVTRVVLDYELKAHVHAQLNASTDGTATLDERREQAAASEGLRIIDGTIQFPDIRLEYETPSGDVARVDLELATEHYKPSQLAAKARAGFTLYAAGTDAGRITAALEERDLVVEIVSL
jgi:hypothetical protein